MARIVIASAAEESREKLSQLLVSSGFTVFRCCASGSELRRTINECEDGIVVLMGVLPDCKPDELHWDYGDRIQILLIAKPMVLESCETPERSRSPTSPLPDQFSILVNRTTPSTSFHVSPATFWRRSGL